MKTIEISVEYEQGRSTEWIPDHELESTLAEIRAHGLRVRVIGEVSWQRQLAQMENPEL